MFVANDVVDTPSTLRWRRYEKWFLIVLTVLAVSRIVFNALFLSARVISTQAVAGLGLTFWSATSRADLSDGQLKSFRENFPVLVVGAVLFVSVRAQIAGDQAKLRFYVLSGSAACLYLHGPGGVFLLLWAAANYYASVLTCQLRFYPICVWAANLAFLVFAEYTKGLWFHWLGLEMLVSGKIVLLETATAVVPQLQPLLPEGAQLPARRPLGCPTASLSFPCCTHHTETPRKVLPLHFANRLSQTSHGNPCQRLLTPSLSSLLLVLPSVPSRPYTVLQRLEVSSQQSSADCISARNAHLCIPLNRCNGPTGAFHPLPLFPCYRWRPSQSDDLANFQRLRTRHCFVPGPEVDLAEVFGNLAVLSAVGTLRRHRLSRKHGSVHVK